MPKALALIAVLIIISVAAKAQPVASSYASRDGRIGAVVITCPSQDGLYTAGPCALSKPAAAAYAAAGASSIATANTAVTVFAAGTVADGCDFVNTGTAILYLDFTTTAIIGAPTALPLQPGQSFHCPYAPSGPVSAIAAQAQPFVAIRY